MGAAAELYSVEIGSQQCSWLKALHFSDSLSLLRMRTCSQCLGDEFGSRGGHVKFGGISASGVECQPVMVVSELLLHPEHERTVPLVLTSQLVINSDEDQLFLMQGRQGGGHPASSPTPPEPILMLRQLSYTTAAEIRHGRSKRPKSPEIGGDQHVKIDRPTISINFKQV
jgi:hypothetical protein